MQQINLLQSGLVKRESELSLKSLGYLSAGVIGLVALISAFQWWQHESRLDYKKQLLAQQESLNNSIQKISDEIRAISDDSELKRVLLEKEKELNSKTQVINVLAGQEVGNTSGFANHLAGLSRQHVKGLWITNLSILSGGEQLNIQGGSLAPEYVPRYIQRLGNEDSFKGLEFKTFVLERDKTNNQVEFNVRSTQKEAS